jgi:hypothetical protein
MVEPWYDEVTGASAMSRLLKDAANVLECVLEVVSKLEKTLKNWQNDS